MRINTGYRDLSKPFEDCNIYTHPDIDGQSLPPVTRVIPDCGHTYFLRGHIPGSPLITPLCRGCEAQQDLTGARRLAEKTRSAQTVPEVLN